MEGPFRWPAELGSSTQRQTRGLNNDYGLGNKEVMMVCWREGGAALSERHSRERKGGVERMGWVRWNRDEGSGERREDED